MLQTQTYRNNFKEQSALCSLSSTSYNSFLSKRQTKCFVFFIFLFVFHCVKELVSIRISDVETVTPHAVVGYCILWWLTSTQDVPTELLEGFFCSEVDGLFLCSLFVHVCACVRVCVCERVCAVNKICLCPQTMADRVLLCV